MDSLKLSQLVSKGFSSNWAVKLFLPDGGVRKIKYEIIYLEAEKIRKFLLDYLATNTCFGLVMDKNLAIPSLIFCFHEMLCAFHFLSSRGAQERCRALNIKWVLSINREMGDQFVLKGSIQLFTGDLLKLWVHKNHHLQEQSVDFKTIFCIMETSGTTGLRKFVYIPHKCIETNVLSLNEHFRISQEDVIYWGTPLTFDPTLVELLLALINGATLILVHKSIAMNARCLYRYIFDIGNVTFLQTVPSLFLNWGSEVVKDILHESSLEILALGGEPFPREILSHPRKSLLKIFNLYGATELSCWATIANLTQHDISRDIPLGIPLKETFIRLEEDFKSFLSPGISEILIGSETRFCLIKDDEKLASACSLVRTGDLGQRAENQIYFRGRQTRSVKIFGHRVNLHKIENLIYEKTSITCRLVYSYKFRTLLAFVQEQITDRSEKKERIGMITKLFFHHLPDPAVPYFISIVEKFPLGNHGKINDKALQDNYEEHMASRRNSPLETANDIVNTFTEILRQHLGNEPRIECNKTFFELGGTSMKIVQVLRDFQDRLGVELPEEMIMLLVNDTVLNCKRFVFKNFALRSLLPIVRDETDYPTMDYVKWKFNLGGCVEASPLVFTYKNATYVACGSFSGKFAILTEKGEEYFITSLPKSVMCQAGVSECGNYVFVGSGSGLFLAFSMGTKTKVWDYQTGNEIRCAPCIVGQNVIFGSYDKHVYCLNISDGALVWKASVYGYIKADPIHDKDFKRIYICTTLGIFCALDQDNGDKHWITKVGQPIFGTPCIIYGYSVWATASGNLFYHKTWDEEGRFQLPGPVFSALKTHKNEIYLGCYDSSIYTIKMENSRPKFSKFFEAESRISTAPFVYERANDKALLITACNIGILYVVDIETRKVLLRKRLPSQTFSSPYVYNSKIYVGCRDDNLYCLDIESIVNTN